MVYLKSPAVRKELVAPHLAKPGLRVKIPQGISPNPHDLAREGHITREELTQHGFLLLEGDHAEQMREENIVSATGPLFFHGDGQEEGDHAENVVSLKHRAEANPRLASTLIGEKGVLLQGLVSFLREPSITTTTLPPPLKKLRIAIQGKQEIIDPSQFRKSPGELWRDWIFHKEGSNITEVNFPHLLDALNYFRSLSYVHTWGDNERLLIDDQAMAHARIPFAETKGSGSLTQSLWHWGVDGVLSIRPFF